MTPDEAKAIEERRIRTGVLLSREQVGSLTRAEARELVGLKAAAIAEKDAWPTSAPDEEQARQANADAAAVAEGAGKGLLSALGSFFKGLLGLK